MRPPIVAPALLALILLAGCPPSRGGERPEIVRATIGAQEYFVPRAYLTLPGKGLPPTSIYVLAFYPDFRPAWDSHNTIWKEGKWKQNINILAAYSPSPAPIEAQLNSAIALLHATEPKGREHGLDHFTQPDGEVQDHRDIWIERSQDNLAAASYVTCGDKKCALYFSWNSNFFVTTSFFRSLLPEWKLIKGESVDLLDSFRSEEAAIRYLSSKATD